MANTDMEIPKLQSSKHKIPMLGAELFPSTDYYMAYIAGRKQSGKTVMLYNILIKTANKNTKVIIFSATHDIDDTYAAIKRMLTKKGIKYEAFDNYIVDGVDLLEEFTNKYADAKDAQNGEGMSKYQALIKQYEKEIEDIKNMKQIEGAKILFGGERPKANIEKEKASKISELEKLIEKAKEKDAKRKMEKNKKFRTPEYIFCFDDMGQDLHKSSISQFIIKHRHYKSNMILLSQHLNFINPATKRNMNYLMLYGGFPDKDLEKIYLDLQLNISLEELIKKYKEATKEKYDFLYINLNDCIYKRNFKEII